MATIRKNASSLSVAEQNVFVNCINQLIQSGAYGELVAIHGDMSHDQHGGMGPIGTQRFLPWHRDFLLKLEQQMQAINQSAFIPYWNWGEERTLPTWVNGFQPSVAVPSRRNPIQVRRSLGRRGRLASSFEVIALEQNRNLTYTQFTTLLEGFHNEVHGWVGGTMGLISISPADPVFWMHHGQVDRVWSRWQAQPGNSNKRPSLTGADAILDPWTERASAMRSIAALNYSYA